MAHDWTSVDDYLIRYLVEPGMRVTVKASSFSAMLELVKDGSVEVRQDTTFAPLWVRRRMDSGEESSRGQPTFEQG